MSKNKENKSRLYLVLTYFAWEQRKVGEFLKESRIKGNNGKKAKKLTVKLWGKGIVKKEELYQGSEMTKYYIRRSGQFIYGKLDFLNQAFGIIPEELDGYESTLDSPAFDILSILNKKFFLEYVLRKEFYFYQGIIANGSRKAKRIHVDTFFEMPIKLPFLQEQTQIGNFFKDIDENITLHQRKKNLYKYNKGEKKMLKEQQKNELFYDYFLQWIKIYKEGAVREITLKKYYMTHSWLKKLAPDVKTCELTRIVYQSIINDYAKYHERQTTMDFHHQLKGAILDAVDEGFIDRDPTRKAIIKGKEPRKKKIKFLNQFELHKLLNNLVLTSVVTWDWFILIVAKTGIRFSEGLAITPNDFDFRHQTLVINKTWDYKMNKGFSPTKNSSSNRKIRLDWQTAMQFAELTKNLERNKPIFVKGKIWNSTANDRLAYHCRQANIPIISIHGLRHTHASLLLFAGVSIASVARRLGHASMNTTQKTYFHIIQELENKDVDIMMRSLSGLN